MHEIKKYGLWALACLVMTSVTALPVSGAEIVFDDMEHGDPLNNGWFFFGGDVGGGGIAANSVDLPPMNGGLFSLEAGYGSGGVPGFFGGFGRTFPLDLTAQTTFNFWILPDAGQDYVIEINLQDDDNGDDFIPDVPDGLDDEFQYNCVVSATGPCAISGGGWQLVSIPLSDFFDDNSFHTGGNGVFDPTPVAAGGNGQLVNVVVALISNSGADAVFRTDYWTFSDDPIVTGDVFDDFEDGDASDWIFFAGNNAGGGGGVLSDRPAEGGFYFSTGWGGLGTDSGFYGGFFKNLADNAQLVPGADPWFNVWVLNQSDATVDQYTLEITIREDLDGNGWTDGQEDSFRLDTVFTSADFNDGWVLVSAPFSDFVDLFTGGDGTFNGNLDEVVVVIGGVVGAVDSTVEADFDFFTLSDGGPLYALSAVGTCPGSVTVTLTGATPSSTVGILFSSAEGNDALAGGPCAGTETGLTSPGLLTTVQTDVNGGFSVTASPPGSACGTYLQIADVSAACAVSNVTQLPQ